MRGVFSVLAASALLSAGTARAADGDWATASVAPGIPGTAAKLVLALHYEMVCGRPGAGPLVIRLPAAMKVGKAVEVRAGARRLDALVQGHEVDAQLPEPPGVTCMSIGPGVLRLTLAGVANPRRAGSYTVRAAVGTHVFSATIAVRA